MRSFSRVLRILSTGCFLGLLALAASVRAEPVLIDGFDDAGRWIINASDGVTLSVGSAPGVVGNGLKLDYDFQRGSGFCTIKRRIELPVPLNYRFSFFIRGSGPANNFEFKLGDVSGDNVWWFNARDYEWPADWKSISYPARKITFAWGPSGGKSLNTVGFIEFAIAAGEGGKGTVFLDELRFEPLAETSPPTGPAVVRASSGTAPKALGASGECEWTCSDADRRPTIEIDFGGTREIGGMILAWSPGAAPPDFDLEVTADGSAWTVANSVRTSRRTTHYLPWSAQEVRALRVRVAERANGGPVLKLLRVEPQDARFGESANEMFGRIAGDAPRGRYPRALIGEQCYWTVAGVNGGVSEALISEDGTLEPEKKGPSLEPFVYLNDRLFTWSDGGTEQSLGANYLPIPIVTRRAPGHALTITSVAQGEPGASRLLARYTVTNTSSLAARGRFFLAVRPFQVLPPWQALNVFGGVSRIGAIAGTAAAVSVNDRHFLDVHTPGAEWGATGFLEADISETLATGRLPSASDVTDAVGWASGALAWNLDLAPGTSASFIISHPWEAAAARVPSATGEIAAEEFETNLHAVASRWRSELGSIDISVPPDAQPLVDTLRSTVAHILINRDGPAIQPGSRTYERTWIRDGSLTSTALLYTGHTVPVRDFLDWFRSFQYENGKIPCCADRRGPDPVPENDSHGQYIYGVLAYYHFTGDTDFLRRHWPSVFAAAGYIERLIAQRSTTEYSDGTPEQLAKFGLVPDSISHEGYSAKPMHSYWDCFFTLRGLKDATEIAGILGETAAEARFVSLRDEFRKNLLASIRASIALKHIDFIPGCVELGDFDATSTAAAIFPGGEQSWLPQKEMRRTFDRYFKWFRPRANGEIAWNEYTPYEMRLVSVMVMLGERERAHEMLDFFLRDRRPAAWNGWGEIVYRDARAPKFIGDMPHTWVGSDFIKAVRNLFVYEDESASSLVLGAGIPAAWIESEKGVAIARFPTMYGTLSYRLRGNAARERLEIDGGIDIPPGGLVYRSPWRAAPVRLVINGKPAVPGLGGEVRFSETPALIEIERE